MNRADLDRKQLRIWCISALLFWCALIAGFLHLFEKNEWQSAISIGKEIGRSSLKKDCIYRVWSASHGGVYVPITDKTPPNPYLSHLPERDITTVQGKTFTLINPAYMTRQVYELEHELYGSRAHLTSLKAIRPTNKPDPWEKNALQQFEQGVEEVSEFMTMENLPVIRVMIPMFTREPCLKCHARHGYKEGDIRGGISVTVPMTDVFATTQKHNFTARGYHVIIFFIGLAGLFLFYRQSSGQLVRRADAENKLRIQGDHLQGIVDNISNGIAVYDAYENGDNFIIKSINPAGLHTAQLDLEDVVGKKVTEAFPGVIEMGLFEVFQRVWKTGKPELVPVSVYRDERLFYWIENSVYKLPTGEIVAVYNDVTAGKQAEEEVLLKTEEWEKTFNAIPDIITLQDRNMTIVRANQAAFDFFQMEPEELLGSTCHELFRGEAKPCSDCPGPSSFVDNKKHTGIIEHKSWNTVFHVCSVPVLDKGNDIQYFVYIAQDITDKKRLEEELFQAHKLEAIGTLAGGIAHDFNNILSAILGYAEIAKIQLPANSPVAKDIDQVIVAGKRATDLVKQILTFSRKTDQKRKPLRLHLIVKEALQLIRASLPTTIDIQSSIDQKNDLVLADPTGMHQIVVNLCTNALHAIGKNKGILAVTLKRVFLESGQIPATEKIQAGPFIVLTVTDTGRGMDEKTVARVFEPYFTTKREGEGTGLGLAVTHSIVEECNGFIEVISAPEKGTSICVYLPAIEEACTVIIDGEDSAPMPTGTENILIVDDEPAIVKISKVFLTSLGYNVTAETKSLHALRKFEVTPEAFDLVITDQTMPDLTGYELSKAMLNIKPDLPIIVCTGYSATLNADGAYAIGIKRLLTKPLDKRKLAETVRQVLDESLKSKLSH